MFCENCGSKMPDGTKFCASCGEKMEVTQPRYEAVNEPPPRPIQTNTAYQPQPSAYRAQSAMEPLSVGQYIGMYFLMMVPLVNIILLFMWSFGGGVNPNKKNFARASLILSAIGIILAILAGGLIRSMLYEIYMEM